MTSRLKGYFPANYLVNLFQLALLNPQQPGYFAQHNKSVRDKLRGMKYKSQADEIPKQKAHPQGGELFVFVGDGGN